MVRKIKLKSEKYFKVRSEKNISVTKSGNLSNAFEDMGSRHLHTHMAGRIYVPITFFLLRVI